MKPIIPQPLRIILGRKVLLIACLGFAACIFLGMAKAPQQGPAVSSDEQVRTQVGQVLAGLKSAYESESLPDFMNLLDRDFENRLTFQSNLENYFISNKNPELMLVTDAVLINKDKTSVRLHWFKKSMNNAGVFAKSEGSCQLVFLNSGQEFKLLYIRGDNPFF
jgi:hypothetical protein